jgi:sec-independent protein translocase protein TatA
MGHLSIWHWLVVLVIVLLLFGRGKISDVMGDVAKGIKSFKRGMAEDEDAPATAAASAKPVEQLPRGTVVDAAEERRKAT